MYFADVSAATVNVYLTGKRGKAVGDPRMSKTLEKFAEALDVEPEYFLEWRVGRARELVTEMMMTGVLDLEDLERLASKVGHGDALGLLGGHQGQEKAA